MGFHDRFGNEIRSITYEEKEKYLPVIKKNIIAESIVTFVATIIIAAMITYFIIDAKPMILISVFVVVLFGSALLSMIIRCIVNLCNLKEDNLGVIHIHSEGIDHSVMKKKKPHYYIKATVEGSEKEIRYTLTPRECETFRIHFGHLREVDYIVVNPNKIKYKDYGNYFALINEGAPVIESAVYDNISKAVNNLSGGGMLSVRKKSDN
ncbi:MAG: hypothetical protein IJ416_08165 [Ruminiclostridium sp.]|nr:hypothetical protein [Ruminiclostridium sp.]